MRSFFPCFVRKIPRLLVFSERRSVCIRLDSRVCLDVDFDVGVSLIAGFLFVGFNQTHRL